MNAGLVSGRSGEGIDDDDFVVARADGHAHAVVFAALVFAHERVGLGIKEIGVRVERMQHAGDGAVVDCLIRIHRLGVVILDEGIDVGELLQTVFNLGVAGHRRLLAGTLSEQNPQEPAGEQEKDYQEE